MPRPRPLPVPAVSAEVARALGGAPLLRGDDRAGYDTLLAGITHAVAPADLIEQAWVRDIVDLIWEALRLRRLKAALLTADAPSGLDDVLKSIGVPFEQRYEALPCWAARKLETVAAVDTELEAAGLGMEHVMAQTLRRRIDEVERIDRMVASAEARRAAALREIASYRAELAGRLRGAAAQAIEEAEYTVVEAAPPAAEPQAVEARGP